MREGGRNAGTKGEKKKKRIYSFLYSYGAPRSILQTVSGDVSKTSSAPSSDKSVIFDHLFSLPPSLGADGTLTAILCSFQSAVRQVQRTPALYDAT